MNAPGRPGPGLLAVALVLGLIADLTLRTVPWGLNATVGMLVLAVAFVALQERHRTPVTWRRWRDLGATLAIAACFCWRDAEVLKALDVLALVIALGLLASDFDEASSLFGYAVRVARTALLTLAGPAPLVHDLPWSGLRSGRLWRVVLGVVRGLALAVPILIVFTVLLSNADAVFALRIRELVDVDVMNLIGHVLGTALFGWWAAGFLRAGLTGRTRPALPAKPGWLALGVIEVGLVLGLVDVLFGGFVWVQLRYLFGGAAWVGSVAGLTYSQYARRGFFELVAVTVLVLPLLLVAHWLVRATGAAARRAVAALAGTQVLLVLVMLWSALTRMRLYQAEYGQTELRFYTTAFMLWLAVLLAGFLLTVLPGRRDAFAHLTVASAFVALMLLHAVNPDARIVVANRGAPTGFDVPYALTLSADATPALLETLPLLNGPGRDTVADRLLARWALPEMPDWRRWSLARARARRLVGAAAPELQQQ